MALKAPYPVDPRD